MTKAEGKELAEATRALWKLLARLGVEATIKMKFPDGARVSETNKQSGKAKASR